MSPIARVFCFTSRPEPDGYADVESAVCVTVEERRFSAASDGFALFVTRP